jgi:hypothetical protein
VAELVALFFGLQEGADQVGARGRLAALEQLRHVLACLEGGPLDVRDLGGQRLDVELALHHVGPVVQPGGVLDGGAEDGGDRARRVGLGDGGDELGAGGTAEAGPQLCQEVAHDGTPAVRGPGGEGVPDQRAQAAVLVAGEVQDVGVDVLIQRALSDTEELGDLPAGERRLPGPQEEVAGLLVEHDERER